MINDKRIFSLSLLAQTTMYGFFCFVTYVCHRANTYIICIYSIYRTCLQKISRK